jgi:bifunctional non-homologous end joining protein LigD
MLMRTPLVRDRRRPPGFIPPCQPIVAEKVPSGDGWIHELKHDGFRIIVRKDGDSVRLWSRNGRDWSIEFVALAAALRELPGSFVLDGEAVAHGPEGLPDFHWLLSEHGQRTACLYAFDLLHLLRKAGLALIFSEHMDGEDGEAMFRHACKLGLEGIISKRLDKPYLSGRCGVSLIPFASHQGRGIGGSNQAGELDPNQAISS